MDSAHWCLDANIPPHTYESPDITIGINIKKNHHTTKTTSILLKPTLPRCYVPTGMKKKK